MNNQTNPSRTTTGAISVGNQVIRKTYSLLSATLIFSAITAFYSMTHAAPFLGWGRAFILTSAFSLYLHGLRGCLEFRYPIDY